MRKIFGGSYCKWEEENKSVFRNNTIVSGYGSEWELWYEEEELQERSVKMLDKISSSWVETKEQLW